MVLIHIMSRRVNFSFVASLIYADSYAEDFNSGLIKNILTKVEKRQYLLVRFFVNFIIGGSAVVFPLIINFLANMTAFPLIHNNYYFGMDVVIMSDFLPNLFYHHPIFYIFIRVVILFFLGGTLATLSLALSTAIKNRYVVLIFPFLVFIGLDIVLSTIGNPFSISEIYLWNAAASWEFITYLTIGIAISFTWYYAAGAKNETI